MLNKMDKSKIKNKIFDILFLIIFINMCEFYFIIIFTCKNNYKSKIKIFFDF